MLNRNDIFAHDMYAPAKTMAKHLQKYSRILLSCHMNPDADAIGSMFALAHGLKRLGKRVAMCNASDVPDYIAWMQKPSSVHKSVKAIGFTPEIAVVLDCGDGKRIGDLQDQVLAYPSICIDHHINNPEFGSIDNWVDSRMGATGQMVAAILHELNIELKDHIAEAIYVAISSDTGSFCYDSTSEQILLLAAYLVGQGLNIAQVRSQMDNNWTLERMRLWGALMQGLHLERDGSIALVPIPLAKLAKYKAKSEDLEGFVENIRRLKGVLAVALVREIHPKLCKASLRSTGAIDVQAMVATLGGGGHRNAAGAQLKYALDEGCEVILNSMRTWLDEHDK